MTHTALPAGVTRFITEYIDSAESLELLLFLQRHRGESYTAEALGPAVYTVPAAALLRLEELVARGLVASDNAANPAYRYAPSSARLEEQVTELAQAYRNNRVAVIQTIFQRPRSPVQEMADAFRFRKSE